jgi:hypothetical protein
VWLVRKSPLGHINKSLTSIFTRTLFFLSAEQQVSSVGFISLSDTRANHNSSGHRTETDALVDTEDRGRPTTHVDHAEDDDGNDRCGGSSPPYAETDRWSPGRIGTLAQ